MMLEYAEQVFDAGSIEEVWALHTDTMAQYGFDRLIYGFTRYKTANSLGDPLDMLILSNHEPSYIRRFIDDGLYFNAPMVHWATENVGACSWRWMEENAASLSPAQQKVVAFNRSMGVTAGYSISFRPFSARSKGAIALTARAGMTQDGIEAVWDEHGRVILAMNNLAHLKIISLPQSSGPRKLTKRQREALEWVGDGKTAQDIALLMGLTPATVEKHLRLAREVLEAETTAQAVLKASIHNQMFVVEP